MKNIINDILSSPAIINSYLEDPIAYSSTHLDMTDISLINKLTDDLCCILNENISQISPESFEDLRR